MPRTRSSSDDVNRRRLRSTVVFDDFPDDLYEKLEELARAEETSVGMLAVRLLERAVRWNRSLSLMQLEDLGAEIWGDEDAADYVDRERASWD